MTLITQTLDDLPVVGDLRDDPDNFVDNGNKMMSALPPMVTQFRGAIGQINTVIGEINATATAIAASSQSVSASETNATAQAQAAIAAAASAVNAPGTSSASTSSLSLTAGTKDLTVATNKAFPIGASVKLCRTADVSKWMVGSVISYVAATGALSVLVDANDINGTGTFADWTVSISGHRGAPAVVAPPTPSLPIGAVAALGGQVSNPVTLADGTVWLRSGTITLASAYPNAIKNMNPENGGDIGTISAPMFFVNGLWIACSATYLATSPNLRTWTRYYHNMSQLPTCVAHDGINYLFTFGTTAYRSADLLSFTNYMTFPQSIAYIRKANGVLFAFAYGGQNYVYTSTDGETWTQRTLPSSATWTDVVWTGTAYVIVSTGGLCVTGTSLTTWSSGGSVGCGGGNSLAFGAGTLVVVAAGTSSYSYSTNNGASWTTTTFSTMTATSSYANVVWTGNKFIASSNGGGSAAYATSVNGASWTEVANTSVGGQAGDATLHGQGGHLLTDGNGAVVMTNYSCRYMSSDHGAIWYSFNRYDPRIEYKLAGNANKAVQAINGTNRIALLEKAGASLAFTSRYVTVPTLSSLQYVAYSGTAWIVCNNAGSEVVRSTDGVNWTLVSAGFAGATSIDRRQIVAGAPNCFITISGRRSTDDGLTWGDVAMPASVSSITAKGNTFVATTGTATYYTSTNNGTTWTQRTAPASFEGLFDGNYWLIPTGSASSPTGAYLHSSSDGINWTSNVVPADINAAAFNSSSVVVGILGQCLIMGNNTAYPVMALMTKDGGASWKFDRISGVNGTHNYQPLWGGHSQNWVSLNTDYCGLTYRQNFSESANYGYGSTPTYYQRVA